MKYKDESIFDDEDIPQTLSKEYLLSRMKFLKDIGYTHKRQFIDKNFIMHFVSIRTLNLIRLNYPLLFNEVENTEIFHGENNTFNLKEINDNYGHYFLIRGNFSYTSIVGTTQKIHHGLFRDYKIEKNINQVTGGHFSIGFVNDNRVLIYSNTEFNEEKYLKEHNDIISHQNCNGASIIYAGELDDLDKSLFNQKKME